MCNCFQTNLNKYRRWQKEARPQRLKIAFLEKSRFFFFLIKRSVLCHSLLKATMNVEIVVLNCQKCNLWLKGHKSLQGCSPNQHGGSESLELGLPSRDRYLSLTSWWLLWLLWFKYLIKKDNLLSWALLDINQYQCKPNQILDRPLVCALFCCSWGLIECTFSSASFSHICSQSMPLMKVARERWWYQH